MKNKILSFVALAMVAIMAFASCEEAACEHTFSGKWSTNETHHWHAATCEHGEEKGQYGTHVDADENGKCDTCDVEIGHKHTFVGEWSFDETNHWKAATCTHSDEKGEFGLHADNDVDGKCDSCGAHVHTLDGAGFCHGCNKEIKPVVETDIASVISAATARTKNIVSGKVDYYQVSRFPAGETSPTIKHLAEYSLGTNGTYAKMSYAEVETVVDGDNAIVRETGKTEVLEKWIEIVSSDAVKGISAISVDGVYKNAQPDAFGLDDLAGYYFAVSTVADGHGAEAVLLSLYEAYLEYKFEDAVIVHDDENNKYDFDCKLLVVNKIVSGGVDVGHTANYYEISVSFTYADDYTLTSLDIECNCWTSDPGDLDPEIHTDIQYLPETNSFIFVKYDKDQKKFVPTDERPLADSYVISVTQTMGTRSEIELNDGSEFAPGGFEIYTDADHKTLLGNSITVKLTDVNTVFYVVATPANAFTSFLVNDFESTVTDKNGNPVTGLMAVLVGDEIQILPARGGEYVVKFTALGTTKTVNVTVEAPEIKGEKFFDVEVTDSYTWSDKLDEPTYYEFVPEAPGRYTFYFPVNFGIVVVGADEPTIDPFSPDYAPEDEDERTVNVTLRAGQTYRFYFAATAKGTYTIGYDAN